MLVIWLFPGLVQLGRYPKCHGRPERYPRVPGPAGEGHWVLPSYMPKVSAKRTAQNKNLGSYAQKKQKVPVLSVRELWGSMGINVCHRSPFLSGTLRPWMKKTLGGMHLRLMMRTKTQFQFFLTSQKKMCQILTSTPSTF